MMFLLMVRVDDPLLPRAMFGVLNTASVLSRRAHVSDCRVSGVAARAFDRRSLYLCVDGFKAILLKDGGFAAIQFDLLFLFVFGIGTLLIATPLFKRTL